MLKNIITVFRPVRWYQNLLIFFGAVTATALLNIGNEHASWFVVFLSFIACCLIASGNYGINEIFDREHDRYHPQKKGRVLAAGKVKPGIVLFFSVIIYVAGFAVTMHCDSLPISVLLSIYFVNALLYNIPPVRLKDRPYCDFISESLNSPIRFLIGWYAVAGLKNIFPTSLVFAIWFFGIFLMVAKRFGELRLITDRAQLENFRKSMKNYSEEKLLFVMIASLSVCYYMLGAFCMKHSIDLIVTLPFIIIWTLWFFHIMYEENTIVKDPERIFEKIPFLLFSICTVVVFIYMLITKSRIMEWAKY